MVRLYHPELGEHCEVPESTARMLRKRGWVDADDREPTTADEVPAVRDTYAVGGRFILPAWKSAFDSPPDEAA